jgi:ribosomal protein S18 acetylase RimI-like enzyme
MHLSPPQAMPTLRPTRRGVVGLWFALVGAVVAVAVVVALIVTWPHHGHGSTTANGVDPAAAQQGVGTRASAAAVRSAAARP